MKRWVTTLGVVVTATLLGLSCGDEKSSNPPVDDTVAPAAITDLVITDSLGTSLHLQWTATGDDDTAGTATAYEVRLGYAPLTDEDWDSAAVVTNAPTPSVSGTVQTLSIDKLAWWTRYYVGIRAIDDAGNASAISNMAAASPYPDADYRLLIDTRLGIVDIDMDGFSSILIPSSKWVEVMDNRIYTGNTAVWEYDYTGTHTRTVPLPEGVSHYGFAALPGGRFAMMNHTVDTVYFIDDSGALLAASAVLDEPDNELQNMQGVVVGNRLIISEDGQNHILAADLTTYNISMFKDFTSMSGWLGGIDYADGVYCVCQSQDIWSFTETGEPDLVATVPEGNITSAVMLGGHTFVCVNFTGEVYRVNNATGEVVLFADGLDYPGDMEMIVR